MAAVKIESYLRNETGGFTSIDQIDTPPQDLDYIEGYIELTINGIVILDKELWDYVDQLWAYISNMILALRKSNEASTYFPDQPIKLTLRRQSQGRILVECQIEDELRSTSAVEREVIEALQTSGLAFFRKMSVLAPSQREGYTGALERLAKA
ncbi:hypothetical protein [Nonomuraea africana]|uniref:hypothetical protein n=1 Tax=Nonomuraea africana TaxID=46171 RepID=UPI0033C45760